MVIKRVLCPQLLRRVPSQFSWIDHRLVRHRHISRCSHPALALYLFLVAVCDGQGLSYWSDPSIVRMLRMDPLLLARARQELVNARLIAWQRPLYQVLALDEPDAEDAADIPAPAPAPRPVRSARVALPVHPDECARQIPPLLSFAEILHRIKEHAQ
jgi:hypothetical protein